MRPKTKLLVVVWGEEYVKRFVSFALPSLFAPGNIPALAEATDLEVVIMTQRDNVALFGAERGIRRLRGLCPVRFVEIDDLITTAIYSVTLTLAFARPILECGTDMVNTYFVFMNADFVLADGSLRSLARHICAGRSIVLGPSFRATAEVVEPIVEAAIDSSGSLVVPTRKLASLVLAHPHPTTVAKIRNQDLFHITHPTQFFWQVDDWTIVGRYFLVFHLCLKPERVINTVNSYSDYGFIPEMCPSGDEVMMGDSDDFFMLEVQARNYEKHLLRLGHQSEDEIACSLAEWTTAEHRRAASYDVVFHSLDIPQSIGDAKAAAQAFVEKIQRRLPAPASHRDHRYWVQGVEAWRDRRQAQGLFASPPELNDKISQDRVVERPGHPSLIDWFRSPIATIRGLILGRAPWVTPLHPRWRDYRVLRDALAEASSPANAQLLAITDRSALVRSLLVDARSAFQIAPIANVLRQHIPEPLNGASAYTSGFIYLADKQWASVGALLEECEARVKSTGSCIVLIQNSQCESQFANELLNRVDQLMGSPPRMVECQFVDGTRGRRFAEGLFTTVYRQYNRFGVVSLGWSLPLLALALVLSLVDNLRFHLSGPRPHSGSSYCSSVLIRFKARSTKACREADRRTDRRSVVQSATSHV